MLILSRKVGDSIIIGDNVVITVLDVRGKQLRLGIIAPKDVPVYRDEIYLKIMQKKQEHLTSRNDDNLIAGFETSS